MSSCCYRWVSAAYDLATAHPPGSTLALDDDDLARLDLEVEVLWVGQCWTRGRTTPLAFKMALPVPLSRRSVMPEASRRGGNMAVEEQRTRACWPCQRSVVDGEETRGNEMQSLRPDVIAASRLFWCVHDVASPRRSVVPTSQPANQQASESQSVAVWAGGGGANLQPLDGLLLLHRRGHHKMNTGFCLYRCRLLGHR